MQLTLDGPKPIGYTEKGDEIRGRNIGVSSQEGTAENRYENIKQERRQGKLFEQRWDEEELD